LPLSLGDLCWDGPEPASGEATAGQQPFLMEFFKRLPSADRARFFPVSLHRKRLQTPIVFNFSVLLAVIITFDVRVARTMKIGPRCRLGYNCPSTFWAVSPQCRPFLPGSRIEFHSRDRLLCRDQFGPPCPCSFVR